ncbi:MAG TPA: class IV adenylate cyclase [Candidatus Thermoplasmatota archaeon]|nr:class IV adenylate cyclase [Candidatus Thermoplasmatota archaeon]
MEPTWFFIPRALRGLMIEFEVKAPVEDPQLPDRLARRGLFVGTHDQRDTYYRHPGRDFGTTDEALRLRRVDDRAELTYKGPKLDAHTKARREITTQVPDPEAMDEILQALGFEPVASVRKHRRSFQVDRFEVDLDEVEGLGMFVEVEVMVPDEREFDSLRSQIFQLLADLGAGTPERRSYLELLLLKEGRR